MKSTDLAKEIAATMSLRLPGTVGRLANKMRYVDAKAPQFLQGGVVRPISDVSVDSVRAVGIASVSNQLPAFGGILYGAAALRHDVTVVGNEVIDTYQDSRIDINDMNYLDTRQRLSWKEYLLAYTLLDDLFREPTLPDIIVMDIPLLVSRTLQSGWLESEDISKEWEETMELMTDFWERNLTRVFPEDPKGPFLVSLSMRHFGAVLSAIKEKGKHASPEPVSDSAVQLISGEWERLREVGIMRILKGLLRGGKRTASYYYDAFGEDVLRAEPKIVSSYGLLGLHVRAGFKTAIWQLETLGNRQGVAWSVDDVDRMCGLISYLTLYDNPTILPLPLWYAKRLVRMPKSILVNYLRETIRQLGDQTFDAAWLEGMDALDQTRNQEDESI